MSIKGYPLTLQSWFKATKVDGIYDKDPVKHSDAVKYDKIPYMTALKDGLKIMDSTAFSLCMENEIPIIVFDFFAENSMVDIYKGEKLGTIVNRGDKWVIL